MDIDAFHRVHHGSWDRLEALARRRRLTAAEVDELLVLYRRASAHLSMIQAAEPDSPAVAQLSATLGRARAHLTGTGPQVVASAAYFVAQTLPAALYRLRWLTVAVTVAWLGVAVMMGIWAANHPQLDLLQPPEQRQAYAEEEFVNYYYEHPGSAFASQVWTNNAWIAVQCVAFGVTGIYPAFVLMVNAVGVGMAGGVMHEQGAAAEFWIYILPHGLLELTAVFVAGAAGLRIFWSWVAPGRMRRTDSLVQEAQRLITVAVGLVFVLLVAGVIEGFVTPSNLPYSVRIAIGAAALAAFWGYTLILGSRAAKAGVSGSLGEYDAGAHQLTA
ncbi:stage II sporulation protein M [Nesterenkonia populi]|uniref:stage II sporulation protein M n=1 Tax=Nesterenkonia populi TaxID=1591087 RepID=UPI0011BFD43B|nr:stage II sporulation protein M [Nesterenkonia populi]